MRCDVCGRPIKNAELWRLARTREAPRGRSLALVCEDCQREAIRAAEAREPKLETKRDGHDYDAERKSA